MEAQESTPAVRIPTRTSQLINDSGFVTAGANLHSIGNRLNAIRIASDLLNRNPCDYEAEKLIETAKKIENYIRSGD